MRLAKNPHPYYPDAWLSVSQAEARCKKACVPFGTTLTWCRHKRLEISSTGHIRELSLAQYIERVKKED